MLSIRFSKYLKIEIIFFITYFYLFRLLSNFEYNFWEKQMTGISRFDAEYSLAYGTSSLIAFLVFYEIVKRYLANGRLFIFIGSTLLFLIGYSFLQKGVSYLFANLDFFSPKMREWALAGFKAKAIGYSLAYMFREFLAISFLAYFIHSAKQNERMKALKEQQLMSELSYLKAQLHPHFFFNTLNNIYSLALEQSIKTAPLVAKLAEMMRYILYRSEEKLVFLKDEITFLRNYVEVEQVRYPKKININFEVQGIDEESKISPLLLLPFIENAFKHGVQEETENGFVTIVICKTEDELTLEVSNSIPTKSSANSIGIGLNNVQKRLLLLYPEKHTLEIENTKELYSVSLTLIL
jgi:sensor histidine kinase YesM